MKTHDEFLNTPLPQLRKEIMELVSGLKVDEPKELTNEDLDLLESYMENIRKEIRCTSQNNISIKDLTDSGFFFIQWSNSKDYMKFAKPNENNGAIRVNFYPGGGGCFLVKKGRTIPINCIEEIP